MGLALHEPPRRLTVLGMNGAELDAQPDGAPSASCTTSTRTRRCRSPTPTFDAAVCCVSVDYLVRPIEVFARASAGCCARAGCSSCTFSNRLFPTKAIRGWLATDDAGHCTIVERYFAASGCFSPATTRRRTPAGHPATRSTRSGRRTGASDVTIATIIVCVDCGGRAHLVQPIDPETPPEAGDILTYRCEDCADRWDLVVDEDDLDDEISHGGRAADRRHERERGVRTRDWATVDFYAVLGVATDARARGDRARVPRRWRSSSTPTGPATLGRRGRSGSKLVTAAYEVLGDARLRRSYDEVRSEAARIDAHAARTSVATPRPRRGRPMHGGRGAAHGRRSCAGAVGVGSRRASRCRCSASSSCALVRPPPDRRARAACRVG